MPPAAPPGPPRRARSAARWPGPPQRHGRGEAGHPEVAGVDLEDAARPRTQSGLVVAQVGAVGGAHLAQTRPRGLHEVREPESGSDLHELTPADDHLSGAGQGRGGEHQRGGAVRDDQSVLRCGACLQQRLPGPRAARGALPGGQVQFHVHVVGGGEQGLLRGVGQWGPPEVGVHNHARGVEHRAQGARAARAQARDHRLHHGLRGDLPAPRALLRGEDGGAHGGVAQSCGRRADPRVRKHTVRAGDATAGVLCAHAAPRVDVWTPLPAGAPVAQGPPGARVSAGPVHGGRCAWLSATTPHPTARAGAGQPPGSGTYRSRA